MLSAAQLRAEMTELRRGELQIVYREVAFRSVGDVGDDAYC